MAKAAAGAGKGATKNDESRTVEAQNKTRRAAKARRRHSKNSGPTTQSTPRARTAKGHQMAPAQRTNVIQLTPYRTQVEIELQMNRDTLAQIGERLCSAIDKVASKYKWTTDMVADAYTYAIKLVYGDGNVDPTKLSKLVRRTVERRFASTAWHMRAVLDARGITMYGQVQEFFDKDYESVQEFLAV